MKVLSKVTLNISNFKKATLNPMLLNSREARSVMNRIVVSRILVMRIVASFLLLSFFSVSSAWAEGEIPASELQEANCSNVINVEVNGLVCDFCARALEKTFGKRDEVANIEVDLDEAQVVVTLQDQQAMDDPTLTKLITDSGYNVVAIQRCGS